MVLMPGFSNVACRRFVLAVVVLCLGFALPLWRLGVFALGDELYSYILLMPLVSVYLAWTLKSELPAQSSPARLAALLFFVGGVAAAARYLFNGHAGGSAAPENVLAWSTLGWLLCLTGAGCWFLGGATMRALAFPFALLLFMIPLPSLARQTIESGLQHGSAAVADWMFTLAGTPLERNGTVFHLPGFSLQVAPECSGIHSTWVLLITSLVAARLLLQSPWRRTALCLAVIPLALLRNGFRVLVIGQLCVHVGPQMIDSPIHHHGGPLFFVLSLIPLFLLLYYLRKGEGLGRRTLPDRPAPGAPGV
jgi:exosortase C (VPDSG-CTERM-specific)